MKKIIAVLLAALFALSLVSCGSGDVPDASQDDVGETTTETAEAVKVSRGVITGDVYVNEFAGFTFTKPADWIYFTDEEIVNAMDGAQKENDRNFIQEALVEKASIYDMIAQSHTGGNVVVCYENTMLTAFRKLTADEYLDELKQKIVNESSDRHTVVSFEDIEDVFFGITEYKKITANVISNGVEMKQAWYIRAVGGYIVGIVITAGSDLEIANIEAMFS